MKNHILIWRSAVVVCAAMVVLFAAVDLYGATAWSEEVTVQTPADTVSPAAPTGLVVTGGNNVINLDWDDNTEDDVAYYTVLRSLSQGGPYTEMANPTDSSYVDNDLDCWGIVYYYVVTATDLSNAVNGNPPSGYSNEDWDEAYCSTDPVTIDDADGSITYSGTWNANNWPDRYAGTIHESETVGSYMTYTFNGSSIELIAEDSQYGGDANIYIDDQLDATVSFFGDHPPYSISKYTKGGLVNGQHTIKIEVAGSGWIYVDALITTTPCDPCIVNPPSAPAGLDAVAVSDDQVNLTWTDTSGTNNDTATGFRVERKTTGSYSQVGGDLGVVESYSDTGLDADTTYTYRVIAFNAAGSSSPSNEDSATTLPPVIDPPQNVVATPADGMVQLTWDNPASNPPILYCIVYRSTSQTGPFGPVAVAFMGENISDHQVYNGTTYYYRLDAVTSTGLVSTTPSETVSATPGPIEVPDSPSNLVATAAGSSQIDLSWTDNSDNETGFKIIRNSVEIDTVNMNVTTYNDTGLASNTTYNYKVVAYNNYGDSLEPNPADSATTDPEPVPAAPTNLVATDVSSTQIDLTWTDNADNEDGFKIIRNSVELKTVGENATSTSDTGLSPNTTYTYQVVAYNGSGDSDPSNSDSATTPGGSPIETTIDDTDGGITYTGNWSTRSDARHSGGSTHESDDSGAVVEYTFTGIGIKLIGEKQQWGGEVDVYIDDNLEVDNASFYSATPGQYQQEIFDITGLANGEHTMRIERAAGGWIYIDALVVTHY